jgi:hypothetical protein
MFPSLIWWAAYDRLCSYHQAHAADVCYVEILQLAATEGLGMVENMVEQLLLAPQAGGERVGGHRAASHLRE